MMRKVEPAPAGFSRMGAALALWAAVQAVASLVSLTSPGALRTGPVLIAWLASLCVTVILLTRFRMPGNVRALMILGIIAVLLAIAAKSDLFGMKAVSRRVADTAPLDGNAEQLEADETISFQPVRDAQETYAVVKLRPSDRGDGGWAERINARSAELVRGDGDVAITGTVMLVGGGGGDRLQLIWSVRYRGVDGPCGMLTLFVTAPEAAIEQAARSFARAAASTVEREAASCY